MDSGEDCVNIGGHGRHQSRRVDDLDRVHHSAGQRFGRNRKGCVIASFRSQIWMDPGMRALSRQL